MQHELTDGPLLDENGNLSEAGFAYSLKKEYNRHAIKGLKSRIKEWDYYYIGNKNYGIALTVADNSYMWMVSASYLDFNHKINITKSPLGLFSFGRFHMPNSSKSGDVHFARKNNHFIFKHEGNKRHLLVHLDNFKGKEALDVDVYLTKTNESSMVIATPFKKKGHFYYNQKINLLKAHGYFKIGLMVYPLDDNYGVLDWGRGIWTYKNTWYWCSASSTYNNERIGWNLGYGFGDTSSASENMFFYRDKAYKLNDVQFNIPKKKNKDDFLSPWSITSSSGDINMTFKPILDRHADSNALLIRSNQHQVFGLFSGTIKINNKEISFVDVPGFAEKVMNRW